MEGTSRFEMALSQPFYRICRPFTEGVWWRAAGQEPYVLDPRYCPNRTHFLHAYHLLEIELLKVFDYVAPADANREVFSHELYQLLLRACTEVEANARAILAANGYERKGKGNWDITDYRKVEQACRLSEYAVTLPIWDGTQSRRIPFENWRSDHSDHSLEWYLAYNQVKHNRSANFRHANLENVLEAICGVFVLLFAQFHVLAFDAFHVVSRFKSDGDVLAHENSLFEIELAKGWQPEEKYDFDWSAIKIGPTPISSFAFL
jgi:hypothetical protein